MRYFIGVDVGGTTTTLAVGNDAGQVQTISDQFPTRSEMGPRESVKAIAGQSLAVMQKLGASINDVAAVGLATPGPATIDGMLMKTPNLAHSHWDRFPIRAELEQELQKHHSGIRVSYLGDGQAAALGEYAVRKGIVFMNDASSDPTAQTLSSLFMAIVGTGLGGGAVHAGRVVRGSRGRAGHIGHTTLPAHAFRHEHDRQLLVGNSYGTAESAISLKALTHQLEFRLSLERWRGHGLLSEPGTIRDKAKRLRELAATGDPLALEMFDDQARALGMALLNANYLGDYELLVIGGGVCGLPADVRDSYRLTVIESYRRHALDGFKEHVEIEFSKCGDDAPVIGAFAWVYSNGGLE